MKIIKVGRIPEKTLMVTCNYCSAELEIERNDVFIEQSQFEPGVINNNYLYMCPCCQRKNSLDYHERSVLDI